MRIIRVQHKGAIFYAALQDNNAVLCLHRQLGFNDPIPLSEVSILPLVVPSKVICVGLNYRDHAAELDYSVPDKPCFFLKPPSSVIGNGQPIVVPTGVGRIDHEAELAIIMGQTCHDLNPEIAAQSIFGYTCANDVTARDLQKGDPLLGHSKAYDTFCPIGPWIETEVENVDDLAIRCVVNGEVRQAGSTADMLFSPLELVCFLSKVMTLLPGDVILTGTPSGVSGIVPGDMVQVEIDTVGVLFNPVEGALEEKILQ